MQQQQQQWVRKLTFLRPPLSKGPEKDSIRASPSTISSRKSTFRARRVWASIGMGI